MKRLVITSIILGAISASAFAITPSGSLELTSKYVWRGTECASGPTLFPSGTLEFGNFSVGAWGAYSFDNGMNELDLSLGYNIGNFSIGITDYYYPTLSGADQYFKWKSRETGHLLEGTISYSPEAFPLTVLWSTMFYGADFNLDDKQAFSSYLEISYEHSFDDYGSLCATAGASILKGFYTGYDKSFSVINLGLTYAKTIELEHICFPLSVSYIINPYLEKSFLTATVGISF